VIALVTAVMGLGIVTTILGSGGLFGIGSPYVCVAAHNGTVPVLGGATVMSAQPGITSSDLVVNMCTGTPSVGQRVLGALSSLPSFLVLIGALTLAVLLFRVMRRRGIFAAEVASRLRVVGWFVLAGELAATLLEALARFWLTTTMVNSPLPSLGWLNDWDASVLAVLLGVVLISFGRIMRVGTQMHEDLDGTV
jgi:hypothetical protein